MAKKNTPWDLGSGSPLRVLESYSNLQGLCFSEMKSINITAPLGMLRHWHEGPKRSSQQQISQNPKTQNKLDFLDTTKNMLYHPRPWNGSQRISMYFFIITWFLKDSVQQHLGKISNSFANIILAWDPWLRWDSNRAMPTARKVRNVWLNWDKVLCGQYWEILLAYSHQQQSEGGCRQPGWFYSTTAVSISEYLQNISKVFQIKNSGNGCNRHKPKRNFSQKTHSFAKSAENRTIMNSQLFP